MKWEDVETNEVGDEFISQIVHHFDGCGSGERTKFLFNTLDQRGRAQGFLPENALDKAKVAATAIELLHTASLVHDDILDNSTSRRELETLNCKFGDKIALIAGDVLFSHALSILGTIGDGYCVSQLITTLRAMCDGQLRELAWTEVAIKPQRDEIIYALRQKTGALFGLSARFGAYFAMLDDLNAESIEFLDQIAEHGEYYGIAYQLRDDLEDIEVDSNNDVITYPLLYGVDETEELIIHFETISHTTKEAK